MCGIAGIIYRDGADSIGDDMTRMLQSMKHRGPDSTGYALYGPPTERFIMRVKLAERGHDVRDFEYEDRLRRNRRLVEEALDAVDAKVHVAEEDARKGGAEHTLHMEFDYEGDLQTLADRVEAVRGVEVISLGHALEIIKDLGDAETVAEGYGLGGYRGTHAIGHVRMATESDVDISNAHPYWAYPYEDVAVVHNGQLTNYFEWRRRLERNGRRFQSDCDSEIIAVYLAEKMSEGMSLKDAMQQSLEDLDGVFTYICVTKDQLGMAKDELAAKPLVLYEGEDMVALASEEMAIRAVIDHEIDTYDPFEGEVMVWNR